MALNLEGDPGECGVEPSEVATGRHGGAAAALGSGRTRLASRMTFSDLDTSTTDTDVTMCVSNVAERSPLATRHSIVLSPRRGLIQGPRTKL